MDRWISAAEPHFLLAHFDDSRLALLDQNLWLLKVDVHAKVLNLGVYSLNKRAAVEG